MQISSRIQQAIVCLQTVGSITTDQPETFLTELKSCIRNHVQGILDHYSQNRLQPEHTTFIRLFQEAQTADLPVSAYALAECKRKINELVMVWTASAELLWHAGRDLHTFIKCVNDALYELVVYKVGWSEEIQLEPLEAWYSEPEGEVVISDVHQCRRVNGDTYMGSATLRPATKTEVIAAKLYDYYQNLD
ncbi:hypothetical protein [Hymenobacter cellulosivorans]|uniref:Uncharacterized protein n=1 Tax=Hymenobacter cellulosivorans TaxID=2932249 RepID=A0ABY4FCP8_9BACT|nr:hypothetical protein [Hymenobacter cellulosivorans]UOQ54426.1 hypothetical protein MUN80_06610 [Hymenobacter cellulosivorans]